MLEEKPPEIVSFSKEPSSSDVQAGVIRIKSSGKEEVIQEGNSNHQKRTISRESTDSGESGISTEPDNSQAEFIKEKLAINSSVTERLV